MIASLILFLTAVLCSNVIRFNPLGKPGWAGMLSHLQETGKLRINNKSEMAHLIQALRKPPTSMLRLAMCSTKFNYERAVLDVLQKNVPFDEIPSVIQAINMDGTASLARLDMSDKAIHAALMENTKGYLEEMIALYVHSFEMHAPFHFSMDPRAFFEYYNGLEANLKPLAEYALEPELVKFMAKRLRSDLAKQLPNNIGAEDWARFQDRYLSAVASGADITKGVWDAFSMFYVNNANILALITINRLYSLAVADLCLAKDLAGEPHHLVKPIHLTSIINSSLNE